MPSIPRLLDLRPTAGTKNMRHHRTPRAVEARSVPSLRNLSKVLEPSGQVSNKKIKKNDKLS